jgi:hypothetical protein
MHMMLWYMFYSSHETLFTSITLIDHAGSPDQQAVLEAIAAAMTGTAQHKQQQQHSAADPAATTAAATAAAAGSHETLDEDQRLLLMNTAARAGPLKPTCSTTNPALLATNLLHEIDQAVQVSGRLAECPHRLIRWNGGRVMWHSMSSICQREGSCRQSSCTGWQ